MPIKLTKSEKETQRLGEILGKTLKGGDVVALYGDLGAGKTVFVKGIAQGLGIIKRILSPTFVFMRSYPVPKSHLQFIHLDLYRGNTTQDYETLGLSELFSKDNIIVLEWADRIKTSLPKKRTDVFFESLDEKTRKITITPSRHLFEFEDSSEPERPESRLGGPKDLRVEDPERSYSSEPSRTCRRAAEVLKNGGVVIFPTDTVYGIGCLYNNKEGLARIYKIKERPQSLPFPVLVSSIKEAGIIATMNKLAKKLAQKYWPGALTIIVKSKDGKNKIGVRMPNAKIVLSLIKQVGIPIIGTSANFHGKKSAADYESLDPKLINLADYVLKGKCDGGIESTVIDVSDENLKIIRHGAVQIDEPV